MKKIDEFLLKYFTEPQIKAGKEIARLVIFLVASDVATQLLNQAVNVPDSLQVKLWVFTYSIPARMLFVTLLTLGLRYIDKLKHENFKEKHPLTKKASGILPF